MVNKKVLKDFLYLDFERIRSFSAQLFSGLIENKTDGTTEQRGHDIGGTLGIPKILSGQLGKSVMYSKKTEETKSLHHQLYLDFEEEIFNIEKLQILNSIDDNINRPFIRINGNIQVIDYKELVRKIELTFNLMSPFKKLALEEIQKISDREERAKKKIIIEQQYKKPANYDEIINLIKSIYGDTLRINFYLRKDLLTSAVIHKDLLQYESSGLVTGTEKLLEEEWITLAQIINKKEPDINYTLKDTQSLDSVISQLIPTFSEINKYIEIKVPLEIIPIAIYREL